MLNFTLHLFAQDKPNKLEKDQIGKIDSTELILIDPVKYPSFPGGADSLKVFIKKNYNWTVGKETIVGKVFIEFYVEKDGNISNISIVKGLHPDCDKEAIRIVKLMPKWNPSEVDGKSIRSKWILPIEFNGLK